MTEQGKALLGDGIPDTQIDVREVFGLDIDLKVPAFSKRGDHVPPIDESYLFYHAFHIPATLHKIDGQPVEQLRMTGWTTLISKIINRFCQSTPEKQRPVAVNRNPGSEWV